MEQNINKPTTKLIKPKNPFIAFGLSVMLPGLGQIYNRQPKKALICWGFLLLFLFLFNITRGITSFYGLISLLLIEILLGLYMIIDGVKNAKRHKTYVLKKRNRYFFIVIAITLGIITNSTLYGFSIILVGARSFVVPTASNNPTFQIGDCFIVDTKAYKKREPNYGEIVVFTKPDGQIYTYRVVGKPNDKLELVDNIITINGKPSTAKFIKETIFDVFPVKEFEEELPNGYKHFIYKFKQPFDSTKINIKDIVVPPDSYYLLGDNRDLAHDSRYEGFIHKEKIIGQAIYTYLGQTVDRINIDFRNK